MQIMQNVTINIDEIAAINAGCDVMCIPDAVEHGLWGLRLVHSSWSLGRLVAMRWTGARGSVRNLGTESGKIKSKKPLGRPRRQKIGEDEC
jgi:hypothetical protein